ncbi:MAG: hypothetical protein JWL66_78 [Sphingomonadales bacterium]|nr:hypothetical protein [Sphingomonadales bacterium]
MLLFMLIGQVMAASPALDFDLGKLARVTPACNSGNANAGGEIIVCAKRRAANDIPIKTMPNEPLLPKAEFKLFGMVRGKVSGEQGNVGPIPTTRAMVTMAVPF